MEIKEIEIPVPWGHIAVKAWGKEENDPVLALHGFADNAGTFDLLIPLLSDTFYYMCFDYPGHGRSSCFPPDLVLSPSEMFIVLKFVVDYLKREKYIFLGHSWGAQIATAFAQLFPKYAIKIIAIDGIFFNPIRSEKILPIYRKRIVDAIKISNNKDKIKQQKYSYDNARAIYIKERFGATSKEAADALIKRRITYLPDGNVKFSDDPRLPTATINFTFDAEFLLDLLANFPISCPVLLLIAENSDSRPRFSIINKSLKYLKKQNCKFIIEYVKGNHYAHINNSEDLAPYINRFLKFNESKL